MLYVLSKWDKNPYPHAVEVDTTSRGGFKDLSPFYLGPLVDSLTGQICQNVENYWQYSKVYDEHFSPENNAPTPEYWKWRETGFNSTKANRYPMGKGRKPVGSLSPTTGELLCYIDARKQIYIPAYSEVVKYAPSYKLLYDWMYTEHRDIVLRDFDGYDYNAMGLTLKNVVNNHKKTMGHAFVIAGMLTGQLYMML